ncbi:MAG: hypothetical protein WD648_13140 [Planctomycetaceae bacterium]
MLLLTVMPVVGVRATRAADPPPEQLQKKVAALVGNLDAGSQNIRTRARTELLELGPAVLPLLPAPERLPSVAVKEAVRDIRLMLEKTQARESAKPTHVATVAGDMSLERFAALVNVQTGNALDLSALPVDVLGHTIRFETQQQTFWKAMDDVAAQLRLRYSNAEAAHTLRLEQSPDNAPSRELRVVYNGAFRVAVTSAVRRPIVGDASHDLLRLQLGVRAEPRLRPLFLRFSARDVAATSPSGGQLEAFTPGASYELPLGDRGHDVTVRVDFRVPNSPTLERIDVRGRLVMQTAAGSETFQFIDLAKSQGKSLRRGGVVTTLRKVGFEKADDGNSSAVIRIAVAYETGGPAFESHRTWIFHNEAALLAADGSRIEPGRDFKTVRQADGAVAIEYRFEPLSAAADSYKFLYVAPTLIINVPIEFEIPGLPVSSNPAERTQP